ncbi:MAG: preprotein translocase subunit Sec61beta [Candidatus Nanoarchaeia archaeon]|nr:preprotein translocase subunit Sec61beta [Candidatus Nanoarchaeia archaeon]MDD5357971.1 preprotein translocase subunit Sec61beta [Candidatus Nanoarchaeia archaeon]MDD5588890.1 preprotein translocase subunit Sec61beta [Candidatus Nanoarchaeia archaeon]
MADGVNVPSGMGGLVKFKEEYESKFNLKPTHIVVFVILIVVFRVALGFFIK